jgi:NAD(P)-dependent dehydrogenase (short-subunit alcohol dehydrogenase family)
LIEEEEEGGDYECVNNRYFIIIFVFSFFRSLVVAVGCSRGIGLGIVKQLLQRTNARVIATCRHPETATPLTDLTKQYNEDRLIILRLDVTVDVHFQEILGALPKYGITCIDILIGNAGISNSGHPYDPVLRCSPKEALQIFDTNVVGNLRLVQTFYPLVAKSSLQLVLLMSSSQGSYELVGGDQTPSNPSGYRISKAGLNMLGVVFAVEPDVKKSEVKTILMHPGWVKTDMGLVQNQPAELEIDFSCSSMLEVIERACVLQMQQHSVSSSSEQGKEFLFSASIQEIESRKDGFPEFVHRLQSDNFSYVQYDGKLMPY